MRIALTLSVILHSLIFLGLSWPQAEPGSFASKGSTHMLSLISQQSRKKRVKKSRTLKGLSSTKNKKQNPILNGNDHNNVKEVQASSNSRGQQGPTSYAQQLQLYIAQNRYYPRRAQAMQQTGVVRVRLTIDQDGRFTNIKIIESSDFEILNRAAKDLITQLKAFKPLPKKYKGRGEFEVPIHYQIRDQNI